MCIAWCRESGKWIVFSLYLSDMFVGISLLILSVAYLAISDNYHEGAVWSNIVMISIIGLLIVGGIMGCIAAVKATRWLMFLAVAFIIVVTVFALIQFMYLIYMISAVDSGELENQTAKSFNKVGKGDAAADAEFDELQSTMNCCGVYGASDYGKEGPRKSCYAANQSAPYEKGCYKAQKDMVQKHGIVSVVLSALLLILLFTTIIWSFCYIGCYCKA